MSVPSFTKTWRTASYPAIWPTRPELSAKGKSVVITGGGTGVGASIACAFAAAGSTEIAVLGRRQNMLENTAQAVRAEFPGVKVLTLVADITIPVSVSTAFEAILKAVGRIDILVSNAGQHGSTATSVAAAKVPDWWAAFETNVKGSFLVAQAFLRQARQGSFLLNITTGLAHMPVVMPGSSSYASSKLAAVKLFDHIAAEYPGIYVVSVQPGAIKTAMNDNAPAHLYDHVDLPGHFCVWLVSEEASFLKGKLVWANWDVNELIAKKDEINNTELLNIGLFGVSFEGWSMSRLSPP